MERGGHPGLPPRAGPPPPLPPPPSSWPLAAARRCRRMTGWWGRWLCARARASARQGCELGFAPAVAHAFAGRGGRGVGPGARQRRMIVREGPTHPGFDQLSRTRPASPQSPAEPSQPHALQPHALQPSRPDGPPVLRIRIYAEFNGIAWSRWGSAPCNQIIAYGFGAAESNRF